MCNTKPRKYFEIGHYRLNKIYRFVHNPRGPRTFKYEKLCKEMMHGFDRNFHTNFKCIVKNLLIETLDIIAIKTAENFALKHKSSSPLESDKGNYRREFHSLKILNEKINTDTPTSFIDANKDNASTNDEET